MNILQEVCAKLGGIPSFDLFYENVYKSKEVEKANTDEPLNPEADITGKYQWAACRTGCQTDINNFLCRLSLNEGWSLYD